MISCSDNGTGVDTNGSAATINGSVESESSQSKLAAGETATEGTVVTAARVTSNGSIETIQGTETEVDASGRFSLEVDASAVNHVVIVAESSAGETKSFISAEIENGQSYTVKPINAETTAETYVFAEIVAGGSADIVQKSDIELAVQSNAAAAINSSSSAAAEIAAGLSNSAEARTEFFAEFTADAQSNIEQAFELMAAAQFQYESNLDAATSANEKEAAFDAFVDAKLHAYSEAGLDISTTAKMLHMQTEVVQNSMSGVSSEIRNSVRASTSLFASLAIESAVNANAQASGVSETTMNAIVDAGVNLRNEIRSSSGASAEIEGAFETYHSDVRAAFESDGSTEATVIVTVDAEINAVGGAKLIFENALNGVVDANILLDIYTSFVSDVESRVEAQAEVHGDVDVSVITEIIVLINLFS